MIEKSQIPSTKFQGNPKYQYSITQTGLEFWSRAAQALAPRVVICLLFVICDLEFLART